MEGKTTSYIWMTTQFEGFHFYADAPSDVSFLRNLHRHLFEVRVEVEVLESLDRELEFFQVKARIDNYLEANFKGQTFSKSCEMIAHDVLTFCRLTYNSATKNRAIVVSVSEDGENGACVRYIP